MVAPNFFREEREECVNRGRDSHPRFATLAAPLVGLDIDTVHPDRTAYKSGFGRCIYNLLGHFAGLPYDKTVTVRRNGVECIHRVSVTDE